MTIQRLSSIQKPIFERLYWRDGVGAAFYGERTTPITDKPDLQLSDEWDIIFCDNGGGSIAHSMDAAGNIIWIPLTLEDRTTISAYVQLVTTPVPVVVVEPTVDVPVSPVSAEMPIP